uniref:Tetraspanin n=1 Tax=Heterorhabditis bacteriophora TaxID=37862 RepID=A0A1I7WXV6_HETBA
MERKNIVFIRYWSQATAGNLRMLEMDCLPIQFFSFCEMTLKIALASILYYTKTKILVGVGILALGVYLFIKDYGEVKLIDVVLNPAIFLGVMGFSVCIISMIGSLGALRDNIFLLKSVSYLWRNNMPYYNVLHINFLKFIYLQFALCVFFCYIVIVVMTFVLFILFYSDTTEGLSAHSVLLYAIKNYHTNRNLAEIVDSLQENLQCCGVSSAAQGYRDWNLSYQFNCTPLNPQPEKCGVPYSCCRKSVISEAVSHDIYTRGCLQPLRIVFESHAVHIGAAVAFIIIPVFKNHLIWCDFIGFLKKMYFSEK